MHKRTTNNKQRTTNLIQLISHPIQYQTPLYQLLARDAEINFQVLYCSKIGLEATKDTEFGVAVKWDIPLLSDYNYKFLKNYARTETLNSFFGLLNLGIVKELYRAERNSVIWIHGWNYATLLLALFFGKLFGHRVFIRGENTAIIENNKPNTLAKKIKNFWFSKIIFKLPNTFLAVGNQNSEYFRQLNVPENKIFFAPYCVDNNRFINFFNAHKNEKNNIRQQLGIPLNKKVIIYSGKFIEKKRPLDLLRALILAQHKENIFTVFVGEGNLRAEMEKLISENNLNSNVLLTGFINQSQMPNYYLCADLYVMCSGMYETWGLSTNEAMCFGLPIILSDMVGSAYNLVDGNGFIYASGDYKNLATCIDSFFSQSDSDIQKMRTRSSEIIKDYSYEKIIEGIKKAIGHQSSAISSEHYPVGSKLKAPL